MYTYAYLIAIAGIGCVWFALYWMRPDLRKQQLKMSLLVAPLAPLSQVLWYAKDYWHPAYIFDVTILGVPVGIEEILFGFFIGGIGSVFYEAVFKRRSIRGPHRTREVLYGTCVGIPAVFAVLFYGLGMSSIWASILTLFLVSAFFVALDHALIWDAVGTAALMTILCIAMYVGWFALFPDAIHLFWHADGLSGARIGPAPIEEVLWFIAWGAFSGVFYEYWLNVRAYKPIAVRR